MSQSCLPMVLRTLRRLRPLLKQSSSPGVGDSELLQRFLHGEEAAFAALVERHGALVLGVCRRVLGDVHAAEDAFQATFLVLARKAGAIRNGQSLSSWLHGVAYRVACKARHQQIRRRFHEQQAAALTQTSTNASFAWRELQQILDEELARLPNKYRLPLVHCYLQDETHEETAVRLGWPVGTVKSRLAKGRELLRAGLVRRGLTLSTAALVTALVAATVRAAVPPALAQAAVKAGTLAGTGKALAGIASSRIVALAQSGLGAKKLKPAILALILAGALVGGPLALPSFERAIAKGSAEGALDGAAKPTQKRAEPSDLDKLQGDWKLVRKELLGESGDNLPFTAGLSIHEHEFVLRASTYLLPPEKRPKEVAVEKLLAEYRAEAVVARRADLLKQLAPTHDPRVAVALAEAMTDGALKMRVAGTYGLLDHYVGIGISGGTESHMDAVARWWRMNERAIRAQASADRVRPLSETDLEVIAGKIALRPDKALLTIEGSWTDLWKAEERRTFHARYRIEGDRLTLLLPPPGELPGEEFKSTKKDPQTRLFVFQRQAKAAPPPKAHAEPLAGTWYVVASESNGKPGFWEGDWTCEFRGDGRVHWSVEGKRHHQRFQTAADRDSRHIDFINKENVVLGIYRLSDDGDLWLCMSGAGEQRPQDFSSKPPTPDETRHWRWLRRRPPPPPMHKGLHARIVAPAEVGNEELFVRLELSNLSDQPVRIGTICGQPGHRWAADWSHTFTPDFFKSDRPPDSVLAKGIVTLAPGKTLSLPDDKGMPVREAFLRDRDYVTLAMGYWVHDPEFVKRHQLWAGEVQARPVRVKINRPKAKTPLEALPRSPALDANLKWHAAVQADELRTTWFLDGSPAVALICQADVKKATVYTAREVHEHATQSQRTRELSHAQTVTLGKLIPSLPPSVNADLKTLLLVSVRAQGEARTYVYDRRKLPAEIVRLIDVTGAYVETAAAKDGSP